MLDLILHILTKNSLGRCVAKNIVSISYAILKAKSLFMRGIATYLPVEAQKQSKVNRIWRYFHKLEMNYSDCFIAFSKFILEIIKTRYVILDFTSLDGYNVKLLFASFPFRGRSIPFYAKVLRQEDIDSGRYKSRNDFIFKCTEEIINILPFKPTIIADREFGFSEFIRFLMEKKIDFIIRLKGDMILRLNNGNKVRLGELSKGKYRGYLKEDIPVKIAVRENKKGKLIVAYSSEYMNRSSFHIGLKYLKRMQCEQYHREIKNRLNLLDLNASYYKDAYNEDFLTRYLIVIMFAVILGIFLGKVFVERKQEYLKYVVSDKQELSLLGLGIFLLNSEDKFVPIIIKSFILSLKRRW